MMSPAGVASAWSVILDMDGLMLDTEPVSRRAFQHASADLGCAFGDALFDQLVGLNARGARDVLCAHYGATFPLDEFTGLVAKHYDGFLRAEGVPRKPGLVEFLDFLEQRRVPRAVATSSATKVALDLLSRADVARYFDVVVGGDQVTRGKPAPDIFEAAAARLGSDPARSVVLEDSGPGIRAARAAGMTAILVPDGREPVPEVRDLAHTVVDSLWSAREVVEALIDEGGRG